VAHQFRTRLVNGELLIGTVVTLGCPEIAELLSAAGFDWLFIDAEHSPLEARDMQALLQGAGAGTPCLVRLSSSQEVPIKKALDIGATGIIAPQVNSPEQAEAVVRFSKYPPQGRRGVGIGRAHGYGPRFQEYVDTANESVAVVVQAEHVDAVQNIEAIVSVPGIDGVGQSREAWPGRSPGSNQRNRPCYPGVSRGRSAAWHLWHISRRSETLHPERLYPDHSGCRHDDAWGGGKECACRTEPLD
jgi:hypothetical protein